MANQEGFSMNESGAQRQHAIVEPVSPYIGINELRDAVKAAAEAHHEASLNLSYLLRRVREEKLYKRWGHTSFAQYVQGELGLDVKYAQSLVRIERLLIESVDLSREQVYQLGLAKALVLVPLANRGRFNRENRDAIMQQATASSVRALKEWTRSGFTAEPSNHPSVTMERLVFRATADQTAIVNQALALAQTTTGLESRDGQLVAICQSYLSLTHAAEPASTTGGTTPTRQQPPKKIARGRHSSKHQPSATQLSFLPERPQGTPDAPIEPADARHETEEGLTLPVDPRPPSVAKLKRSAASRKGRRMDASRATQEGNLSEEWGLVECAESVMTVSPG